MRPKDFYTAVSRMADTEKTKINAAEVSRVLHLAFRMLGELEPLELVETVIRCIKASRLNQRGTP